jgi:hypothetical protein
MTKDGIAEKVSNDLHRLYDGVADEPIPADIARLLETLAGSSVPSRAGGAVPEGQLLGRGPIPSC